MKTEIDDAIKFSSGSTRYFSCKWNLAKLYNFYL